MDFFINIYNFVLYKPLLNALFLLYYYLPFHDFGIAVILLTIIIRVILYPTMIQSIKSQKILSELQPKIQEIQRKYKDEKEKQTRALMELYQKEKINPFGGCLPLLIQFPILIALYQVFWKGLKLEEMENLYSFIPRPQLIDPNFLGWVNLAQPNFFLAILAGLSQYFQTKMATPSIKTQIQKSDFSKILQNQMLYFFPLFTVFILLKLPAAIGLYWLITTLFSIIQQYFIYKKTYV